MNPTFLKYYSQELQHLREMGGAFAEEFPKIAGRLGLERFECADPYVERLLEGFSFLAARIQMSLDARFPRFTQHLTEIIYPQYLAPTPSMAVVQFEPDFTHPSLAKGVRVPRMTSLQSQLDRHGTTRCEYRTAHDLTLWPLQLVDARYAAESGAFNGILPNHARRPKASLRLSFEVRGLNTPAGLDLDRLPLYLRGGENWPVRLYEQLTGHVIAGLVMPADPAERHAASHAILPAECVAPIGFSDDEALLPPSRQVFRGYRLLQEYFAFPERYLFVELRGLRNALRACGTAQFDVFLLLDEHDASLESTVGTSHFSLNCTPAINLFPRRADRIAVNDEQFEYHVVVDHTRPIDFEVHSVEGVNGYRTGHPEPQRFEPFYRCRDSDAQGRRGGAYFQLRRQTRLRSEYERRYGSRSRYLGSEVFIALVDEHEAPYSDQLRQLGLDLLCTNRDLPLSMPVGIGPTDFTIRAELPVHAVRCVGGPSEPRPALVGGDDAWRLLDHLSLNYLSLVDGGENNGGASPNEGAEALRELLSLYCAPDDDDARRQIAGLRNVSARPIMRRLPMPGPVSFGRGLEVTVTFDDMMMERARAFLLGAILQAFFASYVPINHFTEAVVRTTGRGEIMRWKPRMGLCAIV